jgi:uncharacterized Zn-binding protein involved in type VI secretion
MTFPAAKITSLTMHGGTVTSGAPLVLIGGLPASRIRDMHTCPLWSPLPHTGGLISWGAVNVLSSKFQQARILDPCICGAPNMVAMGEFFVLVGTEGAFDGPMGAALLADLLANASAAAKGEGPEYPYAHVDKDGKIVSEYSEHVTIKGDSEYQAKVLNDLKKMGDTAAGRRQLDRIESSDHHVNIEPWPPGSKQNQTTNKKEDTKDTYKNRDGSSGDGADSTVYYNPDSTKVGDGSEPWMNRPPDVGLFHEMHHAADNAKGENDRGSQDINGNSVSNDEAQTVGLGTYGRQNTATENDYRRERGEPPRTR